ncbi:flagellar basal body-associated FliL family protein [Shimia sp. R11_0]|uniref:Flagellar protein FliL n=1 Tax=Shimia marina TaxID=321267 RepID=A0A0N7LRN9_9RHOB|nr:MULTISPECIES: flagellar basal body-associated FliL family protein [Shimia]MBO9476290.1 flagellar basal body-associated FliL family protein [Shimia sp. R11_0]CUH51348.1 Flagellar FliL protein [Shimia marina]SFD51397.1 flagellar FliL protein [Shimia marina]
MTDETVETDEAPQKASKLPLIIGLVLALAGGGGGFFAVYSGMILGGDAEPHAEEEMAKVEESEPLPDIAYVGLDPFVVSLTSGGGADYLRFRAQLEVPSDHQEEVERVLPRVVDVLNGYLRALSASDIESPDALVKLRSQMLRRVQIVTGQERVSDLLVMEFVLN